MAHSLLGKSSFQDQDVLLVNFFDNGENLLKIKNTTSNLEEWRRLFYSPWGQSGRSWRWSGHFENHHQTLHQQYSPAGQEDPPWMVLQRPRVWECHLIAENWLRPTGWTLQLPSLHHGPEWMGPQWHLAWPFPFGLLIDPSLWMPDCTHEDPQLHAGITDGHFYHKVNAVWKPFLFSFPVYKNLLKRVVLNNRVNNSSFW